MKITYLIGHLIKPQKSFFPIPNYSPYFIEEKDDVNNPAGAFPYMLLTLQAFLVFTQPNLTKYEHQNIFFY